MKYEDNNFLTQFEKIAKDIDNLKLDNGEKQYIVAGGALEYKSIIENEAKEIRNPAIKKLQLGKYEQSAVDGHLADHVYLQNLHGVGGYQYKLGYINKTARVIARFVNEGTVHQPGTHFYDIAKNEGELSEIVLMKQRERFLKLMREKELKK